MQADATDTLQPGRHCEETALGTSIPAICENAQCGHVWLTQSFISLGGAATANISGSRISPCPQCGGVGRIADGTYTATSASLWNPEDLDIIVAALSSALARAKRGETAETIANSQVSSHPLVKSVMRFAPKDAGQLAGYLALILAIAQFAHSISSKSEPQVNNLAVPVSIELVLSSSHERSQAEESSAETRASNEVASP